MNTMTCQGTMTTTKSPRHLLLDCVEGEETVRYPVQFWCRYGGWFCYQHVYGDVSYRTFLVLSGQANPRHPAWAGWARNEVATEILAISGMILARYPEGSSQRVALQWAREHVWSF